MCVFCICSVCTFNEISDDILTKTELLKFMCVHVCMYVLCMCVSWLCMYVCISYSTRLLGGMDPAR